MTDKANSKERDFLGGEVTYQTLLDCFERAGLELRPEIDKYFSKFK